MAFNGDGPHSKRQRLEESGHRVSTRLLHDRGPRVPPCELRRLALSSLVPRPLVVPAALARVSTRGRRVAIYRRNDRSGAEAARVPPSTRSSRSAVRQRGAIYPRFPDLTSHRTRARWWRMRATRRDATRRVAGSLARSRPITMGAFAAGDGADSRAAIRRDWRVSSPRSPALDCRTPSASLSALRMSGRGPCCALDSFFRWFCESLKWLIARFEPVDGVGASFPLNPVSFSL